MVEKRFTVNLIKLVTRKLNFDLEELDTQTNTSNLKLNSSVTISDFVEEHSQQLRYTLNISFLSPSKKKEYFSTTIDAIFEVVSNKEITKSDLIDEIEKQISLQDDLSSPVLNWLVNAYSDITLKSLGTPITLSKNEIKERLFQND